ncbi:MAG: outer membrane lipoprotein-sorting protein [Cohaesibacteraceae bacterium]|nr:outer membrane lipoprotein-sorting protein [Cohaesibacteraceae bacterium]
MRYQLKSNIVKGALLAALCTVVLSPSLALADAKGLKIATRSDNIDNGFRDSVVTANMILTNAAGRTSKRKMTLVTLERTSSKVGDKSISVFQSPKDIKGIAVLSHAKLKKNDDQWIYLPAAKRVKRISSSNKSGPFVGSEFAYEDITAQEVGKFSYTFMKTEKCSGGTCDVVTRVPLYKNSGYSKQITWIGQKNALVHRIDFYNRSGSLAKRLTYTGYKRYSGFYRPSKMTMVNLRNKKKTVLSFSNYKFKTGLSDRDFRSGGLKNLKW